MTKGGFLVFGLDVRLERDLLKVNLESMHELVFFNIFLTFFKLQLFYSFQFNLQILLSWERTVYASCRARKRSFSRLVYVDHKRRTLGKPFTIAGQRSEWCCQWGGAGWV